MMSGISLDSIKDRLNITVSSLEPYYFDDELSKRLLLEHFKAADMMGLGLADYSIGSVAAGALLLYLYETQNKPSFHTLRISRRMLWVNI